MGYLQMKVLGIHDGHNASACVMDDGEVISVLQEERITREKNKSGFPVLSIRHILDCSNVKASDLAVIGMHGNYMPPPLGRDGLLAYYKKLLNSGPWSAPLLRNRLKSIPTFARPYERRNRTNRLRQVAEAGLPVERVRFVDHHTCHAASAYYGWGEYSEPVLVLTNDGAGDRLCATVSIGRGGKVERIAAVHEDHSIGNLYAAFTFLTGFVPLEHEYKLMGMAPYADHKGCRKVADELWRMFEFSPDGLTWRYTGGRSVFAATRHLAEFMMLRRFDHIMGGLQLFTEEFLTTWVSNCIRKTGISRVAMAGGTFMNVKANARIMGLEDVTRIFVFPSCGDEANAIGLCYHLTAETAGPDMCRPLGSIYLGPEWSDDEIERAFRSYAFSRPYTIRREADVEAAAADILAQGHVLGRFKGREEFGARSLGNRAILADPSKPDVIKEINEMIKNRDFWMPFASSILDDTMDRYVVWSSEKNQPHYMIMTYDTKPDAATEIAGGIHPYDKTVRPQMITKAHNHDYWHLVDEFRRRRGIGGVLNTSLNLHGLPLVHSPDDAYFLMEHSSLRHLAIGNFIVERIV